MLFNRTASEVKEKYPTCRSIPFEYVAHLFENLTGVQKAALRKKHLATFRLFYVNREADDIFQLYRLLLPGLDLQRGSYGMRESMLGSVLIKACGVPDSSDTAKAVRDWKRPETKFVGDFTAVVHHYLLVPNCGGEEGTSRSGEYKIGDVNEDLDALVTAQDRSEKVAILKSMILKTTTKQMKWIVRVILGRLQIGLTEAVILPDFHPDAPKLYDSTMDLEKVCRLLKDPSVRHRFKDIELGIPVRPQLAACMRSPEEILDAVGINDFVVEIKLDGERCQLHKIGDRLMYFSRRGIEHGENSSYTIFNPAALEQITEDNCILDGELIIWNKEMACFEPFGSLRPAVRAAIRGVDLEEESVAYEGIRDPGPFKQVHQLPELNELEFQYLVFDILHINDHNVIDVPLKERQNLLRAAIRSAPLHGTPIADGRLNARILPLIPDETFLEGHLLTKKGKSIQDITEMLDRSLLLQACSELLKSPECEKKGSGRGSRREAIGFFVVDQ